MQIRLFDLRSNLNFRYSFFHEARTFFMGLATSNVTIIPNEDANPK
ncbi:hypothetical protein JDS87_07650 [Bacillus cereus]|nr:hypothetical protein [Bacillus cereus]